MASRFQTDVFLSKQCLSRSLLIISKTTRFGAHDVGFRRENLVLSTTHRSLEHLFGAVND